MAIFDKIKDFVKPFVESTSLDQPKAQTTTASVFKPEAKTTAVDSVSGAAPKASVFKPAAKTAQPSLSSQSIQNDKQKGIDWSSASPAQRAYNDTYYKTLDEPTHTKMFRDLQSFTYRTAGGADVDKSEAFRKSYKEGTTYLDNELKDYEKRYGKDSYEYKALQQFKGDYESLGRQVMSKNSAESAAHLSRQLDDTIDSVFAGYTSAPDYQEKVEKGKKEILGNPKKYGTFTLGMKGASEKQKDLLYAVFAEEGEKGAEDFYKRFLNPTVSRIGAEQEFSETIASDSKAKRALGAAGAAVGGAIANSSILGGGVQKGIDVLTGKAKALDDDVLAGDFTVQDSVDNTLRSEFAGINQADLDQYGLSGLDAMKGAHDGKKTSTGQYGLGNIDLTNRDTGLYDEDGNLMTVKSMSFEEDGKEILVPTIVKKDGKWVELSEKDAIDWYHQTGEYLGKFDTVDQANAYAQRLHQDQQQLYTDYDWLKAADQDATDYQKQLLGYVYLASDRDEAAAKDLWEAIKARDSEIRQTVNGGTYGTTSRDAVQSGLYQEYLDKNKLMLGLYKAAVTTGSQLDRVALSFIPVVGQALNLGTMGLSVFGNAYSEDVLNGREEDWKTAGHALTSAALEVVMEKLLSGVAHIPGIAVDEMSKRFVKNIANPWGRAAANTFLRFQSEGLEEGLTDAANALSTGLWFGEGDIASRAKQGFELDDVDLQQMLESYFYGGISALFLGGLTTAGEVVADINYRELGHHLNTLESTDKLIDTILNTKIDEKAGKSSKKLYDEAKELAQGMKDGKLKKNDVNVGEMFANFAKSGGDVQWLTNPDTVNYNKDTLTEENFIAGATSRLSELGADTTLAGDIARWAMGQQPSQEAFNKIKSDPRAAQVLQELLDPLDTSKDTALTRAVQSTTRDVTGNKTYDTLVASNPDQVVVNPATQQLISLGVELEEAQGIGDVIAKVMSGESITEDEAELISVSNAAVRSVLSEVAGVELSEDATIGAVMDALNAVATETADTKAKQAAVAESAEAAARARMPIPPNTRQTITAGGIEFGHDEFIQDYMAQHNATLEQAEEAWAQRAGISAALNGEEENNGTISGKQEGRNPGLAGRGPIPAAQERTAGSGRSDVSGTDGGTQESGQRADGSVQENEITKFNSEQREFIQDGVSDGFTSVSLVNGPLLGTGVDKNGNPVTFKINAKVDSNGKLTVRWDNPYASPQSVERHERIHRWLDMVFGPRGPQRAAFVMNFLNEAFEGDEAAMQEMYNKYLEKYGGAYSALSAQEMADWIYEEIFADMYAGLDMYDAGTAAFQEQAEMYVVQEGLRERALGEETADTDYGGSERYNVANPFRDSTDWNLPADVRPFPGEKPMHTQLERFSISSMAQGGGFDLELNKDGYPYALIDKATGERVTNVTGDMMKGTPLGDIVQMAVDNGGISEAEARKQRQMLADAMNMIVKYNDAAVVWELAGSQMFSAIKSNSDKQYNKTIDFSTICKKTMAIVDAMSETMKRLGRGLTRREVEAVYLETGKAGEATPCPVCYVFSRWMGIGNLLDQMSKFQDKYAGKSEEELLSFMKDIEDQARAYAEAASPSKKEEFFDKNGQLKIGKVISDMKSKPNSKAASAIKKLNQHQQALDAIKGLTEALPNASPEQAPRWRALIKALQRNVLSDAKIAELQQQMAENDEQVEVFEVYQWLAKTVLMPDSSEVNEDGEAVGSWKKNPDFKPVPKDILFDLNRGGDFAKDYPLSWAFRTGKGCAMGKAITPYADARVGETIQGVDLSDVKNIRMGEFNEFLNGDVEKQKRTLASAIQKTKKQNLIGGMRYQSTSDFRYEFGSDYLMTFFEMQALGANVQLYTKVIEAVDFLASTGADCNLSVMPLGDGYVIDPETGEKKLVFSNVTGINAEAAIKKSKQYDNVQLILVGINDENVRLALAGTDVTFVIPFHGSGQSVHQVQTLMDLLGEHLDVTKAQDYTSVQSDHVSPKQTAEQKAMWDLRLAIIMGECENGLTSEQQALLDKNEHLQKLYNMFYEDESSNAYHNYLAKDQAQQIFPYEYWDKTLDYDHADRNGEIFQEYCKSMGIVPRFSGLNAKGERTGFGDFTKDKGYWKLLIDRSMYRNVYDANGEWISYGEYRDQQQINMSNVRIGDLDPETGKAQFTNGEMSKQYDATRNPADRQNLDTIVTNSIQRIEAMRDKGDVFDRTQVNKSFRGRIMEAQSELRERYSAAPTSVDNGEISEYTENISVDRTEDVGDGINRGYEGNAPRSETQRAPEGSASSNDGRRISPRSGKKNRIEKAPDWGSYSKKARTAIVSDVVSFLNEYGTEECWEARADYRKDSDFVADLYKNTYQKSGGNRTLFETYAKGYTTEPGNLFKAFEDNISKDARTETGDGRFDLVERYSLAPVPAVEPSNDSWNRTHTTEEAMEIYPDLWNVSAEESETRNPTQIASTQGTYRNIYKILQDQGFDGKILDASSGLGIGTQIGRDEFGFDVEDIEPYPGENYSPMYTDYSKLNNKYDAIISSAVLNVLPQDQRDALVVKMGELLNDGGKMYITTRGKDVDSLAKTGKNIQLGPMEWIETVRGSYQKGFTQNELKAYLEDALGPGFTVELSNKSNGGKFNNNTSIVVTKSGESVPTERYSAAPTEIEETAQVTGADLKDPSYTGGFTSEAEWRDAVKKDKGVYDLYTDEMVDRWGIEDWRMGEMDAAMVELLDRIDKIHETGRWSMRDLTGLQNWDVYTDFIELLDYKPERTQKRIEFMIRNLSKDSLENLKWFPVQVFGPDNRNQMRKAINLYNKIINAQLKAISANENHVGRDIGVNSRKSYNLSDIRTMFEEMNDNEETGEIAKKVFDWAEKMEHAGFPIPFKFKVLKDAAGVQLGGKVRYDTKYFNNPDIPDTRKAQTLLHEVIHVYSAYAISVVHNMESIGEDSLWRYSNGNELRRSYNSLPTGVVDAVHTLDDIWAQIRYDPLFLDDKGRRMYGVTNTNEMVAELANPEFRAALKKKSLLQRILDAVKRLFGIETTNAYDAVSAGFDKLMTSSIDDTLQNSYQNYMDTQDTFQRFSVAPTDENSNPSPFKEGSLEATVSDLIQKADDGQALQDTINALIEKRNESLKRNNAPVIPSKDKARPVGKVQREIQQNQLQDLINKYGALKKGEKAAKDVTLPERTGDERYTRRFVRTTEEAAGIPERMNERIDDSLLTEDLLTYSRITDKMAIKKGDGDFEALGYKKAIKEWNENRAGTGHQPTKYDIAFGERLMIEAARNGDEAVALKVLADLAAMETQAGQVVQAARLLKKLGPTGQLYYIQKAVDRLNKQNEGRIAKGSMQPITIDKELAKAVILSETDEQMKDTMDALIASIAEQLPVTLKDKWDAWRYLSMLGNPRTHIRNVFGNAVFSPIRFTKDLLASAGEKMFIKDPLERTKAADARLGSKKYDAVREFAASDFEEMKQQITGTGKMNPLNEIMDKRKIFKSKAFDWLNKLSDWNSDMLEKEDAIFLRKAYIDAMTQFIAAKGLTLEELTGSYEGGKILNDARQYAALEAQKATYRDFNQMASALNQMKRTSGVGWFIDGLMPFTKTPMNILRRGIEYSPVGLANGIYSSLVRVGKGDISAAGAIDQIAAGMTGTGIAILGYFLAKMGLARGGEDDDDKKAQLEAAEGHQKYSLEIPGYGSYTIDWMAPVALPFFVGVEVFNQLSDGGKVTGWDLANAMTMIAEPMMSLSMLDGLNSTLSAVRYGDEDQAVMSVATNILTSYLSQGAPTIFGQIARTIDPDRRSTYTDKNSATPAWLQRFVQGVQGKAPGVESQKMAYVDAWGRKDTNASLFWRAVENFISPGYANRINETPVDRELTRLAESLGDTSVLPSSISKYYQLNGERLDLNAKQYEKLKTVTGQTAFSLLGNMMDDVAYIAMGDEEKAAVVKQIMSISAAIGKQAVTPDYKPDAWIQRAIDQDNLENAAVYHALEKLDTGLSNYQLISAMDWLTDEDRGKLIMSEHTNTSRNMTDYAKKKYKFVLTDEQIAREREIYNDLFWPEYANLINDPKYINAGVAERADMISKMQSALGEAARRQLGDELRAAGYTSVLLDDSDVPEQVIDLYSLLNRG